MRHQKIIRKSNKCDKPFTVRLSDESFETYELDPPSYELETTKKELKQMYYDMVASRYVITIPGGGARAGNANG
jgi:hypothetical protein